MITPYRMFYFAQIEPPVQIAAWLACAAFVLMMVNGGFKLTRNFKGTEPLPPNGHLDLRVTALGQDVQRIDSDVRRVDQDVKNLKTSISENGEIRKAQMIDHIDQVRRELDHKIQTVSDNQTRQLLSALKGKND